MSEPSSSSRRRRYALLARYALPYKRGWALILTLSLLATGFGLLQPWPLKILIDNLLKDQPLPAALRWVPGVGSKQTLLVYVVVGGFVTFLGASLVSAASTLQWIRVGQRMVYDVAADLFANLQRRSLVFHSRHPVGDSVARITGDCWSINGLANALLLVPIHSVVMLIGMVVLMAMISVKLTAITVALTPFMALAAWFFGKPIRESNARKREVESAIQAHVQQTLTGIPVVQAFGQEDREQQRFRQHTASALQVLRRTTVLSGLAELTPGLLAVFGTAGVLWFGGLLAINGDLSPGSILMFLAYMTMMQSHFATLLTTYTTLQGTLASADRVLDILQDSPRTDASSRPPVKGHLRFEDVRFAYTDDQPVLHGISFEARPGQTIAVVGPTGAGKSTLVSLIPRLLEPASGRITLDGTDLREFDLQHLRANVALVLQEAFLFPLTIAQNIALGRPDATREQVVEAAKDANAHEYISRLPRGYDTELGERGVTLSGGERQRLSIARALLKDAPILVLDEPTSALDARTEGLLLDALQRLMKGRTTIVIAHRLSTIRDADNIVVLEQGRVVEQGTHAELVAKRGLYYEFQNLQVNAPAPVPGPAPAGASETAEDPTPAL